MPKQSQFRHYVYEKWYEYKDEVLAWEHRPVTGNAEDYFNKWKWFLKAKYKVDRK